MKKKLFRKESDFLGAKLIFDDLYYGIQTLRAIRNFPITGQIVDKQLIKNILLIKKAACWANSKTASLSPKKSKAIFQAINQLLKNLDEEFSDLFPTDSLQGGAYTSVNMNINEVIANTALEILGEKKGNYKIIHPNDDINQSQSTNDVVPTAMRLTTIDFVEKTTKTLKKLINSFDKKSDEFNDVIKLGRTHLQDAVPITLGTEFKAYSEMVRQATKNLISLEKPLSVITLGGTAIGTCQNASPRYIKLATKKLSELVKIKLTTASNLVQATQDQTIFANVSSVLKLTAVSLSKIASDLRLLASGPKGGIGEITLPSLQPGSSIMPGKVNPVIPELVNQCCFLIIGNDLTVSLACESAQLELNVMAPVIANRLFNSFEILTNVVDIFDKKCIRGIKADKKVCQENLEKSTALATVLAKKVGYEKASQIAKEAIKRKKSIREIVLKKKLLSKKEFDQLTDYKK